ncbi:glycoside hydrolase family 38 C-terminal domain-containing protein [Amorphoplanes nipponensis]|uniref:Alpha-mannosidase n=1 Tax=Actinoplanes nipponensis TaxID=135950 RepID=A0A919JCL5_9ACTN|nr:glycoside hydrolase family 38 C-terminal domain-containing protein [Actinoplanes nipponensis]GIE46915.1 alpha-mannosidase [Actinoplanes nipponensis]
MHTEDIALDRLIRALRDRIRPALTRPVGTLEVAAWDVGGEPVGAATGLRAPYRPFAIGQPWGRPWDTTWFRVRATVPDPPPGDLELVVDLGWRDDSMPGFQAEALAYDADGTVLKAVQPRNNWVPVRGPDVEVFLEAAANPQFFGAHIEQFRPTPLGDVHTAGNEPLYTLAAAAVVVRDAAVAGLIADLELVAGLIAEPAVDSTLRAVATRALQRAIDTLDARGLDVPAVREPLAVVLDSPADGHPHRISATGHAHIDSAWLWPLRETRRKVARTVANVLQLMDAGHDLVHVMSAAQHWEWLREDHPALFERARERVAEGRFVPVGGMWVESDTVLPGGEAMVRQFTEGQRYFLEHFGTTSRVAWLPDSFGYSGALPQIVRQAGIEYFLTQKISWNRVNRFPHHTLHWVGIDGTGVFTHFPPADTYNGELTAKELIYTAENFREKGAASRSLIPFGFGDGGGGPTREMLARAARAADQQGLPRVRVETPEAFFDAARAEYPDPPQWFGELYLELHRGTLTSQAAMKRGNRRAEHLLRAAELWATTAMVTGAAAYPYDALRAAWRTVLLHQFHDILPGSSIRWVHRAARQTYEQLIRTLEELIGAAQTALAGDGTAPVTFNAAPVEIAGTPAGGARLGPAVTYPAATVHGLTLTSETTAVTLATDGTITSVRDLATGTEAIAPGGRAGLLQLHPDYPAHWDAWDVDRHYRASVTDVTDVQSLEVSVTEDGAARAVIERRFASSAVRQTVTVRPGQPGVEIVLEVDWHEQQRLLKLGFDVDVHAERARFETQFGHVTRPTHENTSWDAARFEVAAHRWVHVGEPVGVALANDATYGHEVRRVARHGGGMATSLRATLVRGPQFPDPQTDQGRHEFRFHLLAAATVADAVAAGYRLNLPPVERPGVAAVEPLVRLEGDANVLIEAVKPADDRSGDVVVRLYESHGVPGRVTLRTAFPTAGLSLTDLLERHVADTGPELRLRPFQIVTVRLRR